MVARELRVWLFTGEANSKAVNIHKSMFARHEILWSTLLIDLASWNPFLLNSIVTQGKHLLQTFLKLPHHIFH